MSSMMMMTNTPLQVLQQDSATADWHRAITQLTCSKLLEREFASTSSSSSSSSFSAEGDAFILSVLRLLLGSLRETLHFTLVDIVTALESSRHRRSVPSDEAKDFGKFNAEIKKQLVDATESSARRDPACRLDKLSVRRVVARVADLTNDLVRICAAGVGDGTAAAVLMLPAASPRADQQPFDKTAALKIVRFYATMMPQPSQGASGGAISLDAMAARYEVAATRFGNQSALLGLLTGAHSVVRRRFIIEGGDNKNNNFGAQDRLSETLRLISGEEGVAASAVELLDAEYFEKHGVPKSIGEWWKAAMFVCRDTADGGVGGGASLRGTGGRSDDSRPARRTPRQAQGQKQVEATRGDRSNAAEDRAMKNDDDDAGEDQDDNDELEDW